MANSVIRKSYTNIRDERVAAGTITPGMLVEILAAGTVQAHGTAAGEHTRTFALEDSYQGNGLTDNYSSGQTVILQHFTPGEVVNVIANAAITAGDFVESAGNGKVRTQTTGVAIGQALEAAGAGDARIDILIK